MYVGNFSTASNRADWQEAIVLTDVDTGELIDISLCRITLTISKLQQYNGACVVLTGSTDSGEVTLPATGTFQWLFTADRMGSLLEGEYQVGVRISQDTRTMQLIIGAVTVMEGIDTQ